MKTFVIAFILISSLTLFKVSTAANNFSKIEKSSDLRFKKSEVIRANPKDPLFPFPLIDFEYIHYEQTMDISWDSHDIPPNEEGYYTLEVKIDTRNDGVPYTFSTQYQFFGPTNILVNPFFIPSGSTVKVTIFGWNMVSITETYYIDYE